MHISDMDISETVKVFVMHSQLLRPLLKRQGEEVSDLDLHTLMTQLHILEMEVSDLQTLRHRRTHRAA
jgi:hypothetical protein